MKKLVLVLGVLAAAVGISALATPGSGRADQGGNSYSIGLWGDVPYSVHQQTIGVPNLIEDMNSSHLAFTVHDGDLKQGSGSPSRAGMVTARVWASSSPVPGSCNSWLVRVRWSYR